jgi:hypothetical protein
MKLTPLVKWLVVGGLSVITWLANPVLRGRTPLAVSARSWQKINHILSATHLAGFLAGMRPYTISCQWLVVSRPSIITWLADPILRLMSHPAQYVDKLSVLTKDYLTSPVHSLTVTFF